MLHCGGGYFCRTNGQGFRSDFEFQPTKKPGVSRVLLFGDSFTAGQGVSNKFRYSDVLASLVPNLEIYNYGLPACGPDQHYLIYQNAAA